MKVYRKVPIRERIQEHLQGAEYPTKCSKVNPLKKKKVQEYGAQLYVWAGCPELSVCVEKGTNEGSHWRNWRSFMVEIGETVQ